jgi:hypothetical protein
MRFVVRQYKIRFEFGKWVMLHQDQVKIHSPYDVLEVQRGEGQTGPAHYSYILFTLRKNVMNRSIAFEPLVKPRNRSEELFVLAGACSSRYHSETSHDYLSLIHIVLWHDVWKPE